MRSFLAASLVALLAVATAGVTVSGTPDAPAPNLATHTHSPPETAPAPLLHAKAMEFCVAASGCEFWDNDYHEFVLYDVDTPNVDVLIVPSASPDALDDTRIMRRAVDAWSAGIASTGASWFASGFHINAYTVGTDTPPASVLQDPEIVIVGAAANPVLLFGIGEQTPASICAARGGALQTFPVHEHDGMQILAAECTQGGMLCVALNTNFLLADFFQGTNGAIWLQDLVAHEFGHCLGGGHVGDALDFDAKTVPIHDIMSYQHDDTQVHCVSNLNVRVLEGVYAALLGQPASGQLHAGDYLTMSPAAYSQLACSNP
ncbi:MAG TPA: hypothetical protein VM286_03805 [Candidatus Thermoplasmatota archaeon]|nr:hypothetical protein [Candidatus Thermoplasmatota archaeon]